MHFVFSLIMYNYVTLHPSQRIELIIKINGVHLSFKKFKCSPSPALSLKFKYQYLDS